MVCCAFSWMSRPGLRQCRAEPSRVRVSPALLLLFLFCRSAGWWPSWPGMSWTRPCQRLLEDTRGDWFVRRQHGFRRCRISTATASGAGQIPSSMSSETCFVRKCREPPPTKQARGDGTAGRLELCRGSGATTRRRTGHTWADADGAREGGGLARRHRYRSCWPCGCPGPVGSRVLPECSAQMFCPEAQPPGLQFQAQSPVSKPLAQPPVFKTSRPQGPAGLETDPGPAASAFGPAASSRLQASVPPSLQPPRARGGRGRRGGAAVPLY